MDAVGADGGLGIRLNLFAGHGDRCEVAQIGGVEYVRLHSWRLFDPSSVDAAVFDGWNALWEGSLRWKTER